MAGKGPVAIGLHGVHEPQTIGIAIKQMPRERGRRRHEQVPEDRGDRPASSIPRECRAVHAGGSSAPACPSTLTPRLPAQ